MSTARKYRSKKKAVSAKSKQSKSPVQRTKTRIANFRARRPHRSFVLTRRRDYTRSLKLPGYVAFTFEVGKLLKKHWRTMSLIVLIYALFGIVLGTMLSQSTYVTLSETLTASSDSLIDGALGTIGQSALLAISSSTNISGLSEAQQIYAGLIFILVWLSTVWLLREFMAGRKPKVRDGLYNSSAPLVSTTLIGLFALIQLVPLGLVAIVYSALAGVGILTNGFGVFLISILALLVLTMTLYWLTSTFFALIIVTLPGMYPMRALKAAGDLVIGRRLRILYRLVWLFVISAIVWLTVMISVILLEGWLSGYWGWLRSVPVVPFVGLLMSALVTVWIASYIYVLYRKVVDDESSPA